ncbi:TetR/AcrR family transcriptional regulator [Rothia aerolata]|uniref:TetR family transcriptional regulator n=1 Tax=Rothia aerolata TaxID=1812262 RepID=A0A917MTK0_9MICC|nr:TetR/AcrR family transcriptional regulator [Rothia aerolata]GGH59806.1 TetR family transcriptional regulator [Rothia aerolata]
MTAEFQAASDSTGQIRLPRQLRRQQLVYSALRVFSNQGYHVTTMNHIASAADVTKPVLYQHFKSKRDLYLAVLDEQIDEMVKQVVTPLYATESNRARVEGALGAFFEFCRTCPQSYRLIFESDIQSDIGVQDRLNRLHHKIAEHIAGILGPNAGLGHAEAVLLSRSLTGMVISATEQAIKNGASADELAQVERLVFRLAWGGISIIDEDWQ